MNIPRILLAPTAALAIILAATTISATIPDTGVGPSTPTHTTSMVATGADCEEDQPCWNCEVDGNKQCGVTEADRVIAWAAWDKWQGWRTLRVDPTREFRVDVTSYSLERPNSSAGQPVFEGEDGRWYSFTATYTDLATDLTSD